MKKIFTLALLALATIATNAQTKHTVNVWVDGQKTTIENVDSLTFTEDAKPEPAMEYVDLGLSVKWATCNLGATKDDEIGNYYAWGETEPKVEYSENTWKFNSENRTKYNDDDNKLVLDPEDDAATVALGADWRMPDYTELEELMQQCEWTWTTDKERPGFLVKSNKNGNTIFIPTSGSVDESGEAYGTSKYVQMWTSERPTGSTYPYNLFAVKAGSKISNTYGYIGMTIRPVYKGK